MKSLTVAEWIELLLIVLLVIFVVGWFAPLYPFISSAQLCLWLSVLLLCQSLIRDSWILLNKRSAKRLAKTTEESKLACMCLESTVGTVGVLIGLVLALSGFQYIIEMNQFGWGLSVSLVLVVGFLIKDWLFGWQPWRLLRGKDHNNIIFQWKK